jgi:hypothetical protein
LPRPVSGAIRGLDAKAIVVGLTAAFVVGTALTWIRNEDQLLRDHDELPLARYLSVLVGGAFSQFLGGFIAGRMASGHQLKNGLVVAVPLFVLQLALFSVPSVFPDWGRVVSLIGVLPTTILGSVAAMRRPRSATSSV